MREVSSFIVDKLGKVIYYDAGFVRLFGNTGQIPDRVLKKMGVENEGEIDIGNQRYIYEMKRVGSVYICRIKETETISPQILQRILDLLPVVAVIHDGRKIEFANVIAREYGFKSGTLISDALRFFDKPEIAAGRIYKMMSGVVNEVPEYVYKIKTARGEIYAKLYAGRIEFRDKVAILLIAVDITAEIRKLQFLEAYGNLMRNLYLEKERLLENFCSEIKKVDAVTGISMFFDGQEITTGSESDNVFSFQGANLILKIYSSSKFKEDEEALLHQISQSLEIALNYKESKLKLEEAYKRLETNLKHFEFLADRLRNPLAAIVSSLELKDSLGERTFEIISESSKKILEILDKLSVEEKKTMKIREELSERR
jgi:PAS domain-containing protein